MDYIELLEHSFAEDSSFHEPPHSRLDFLANAVFDFTTYDPAMSELFARKALEVCAAINNRTTFEYIENKDNYQWYLLMLNMPFFEDRIDWGTSIRGAWWNFQQALHSCGLWVGKEQRLEMQFTEVEWKEFVSAMIQFAGKQ